jgi:hypothetical protein
MFNNLRDGTGRDYFWYKTGRDGKGLEYENNGTGRDSKFRSFDTSSLNQISIISFGIIYSHISLTVIPLTTFG